MGCGLATAVYSGMLVPPSGEGMPTYVVGPCQPHIWQYVSSPAAYIIASKVATSQPARSPLWPPLPFGASMLALYFLGAGVLALPG